MLPRLLLLVLLVLAPLRADDDYTRSIEAWHQERLAGLRQPTGWLTLIGRHQLSAGDNSVGTAADNSIRLAAGPPYLGTVAVGPDQRTTFLPAPGAIAEVDGVRVSAATAVDFTGEKPTRVAFGTASFTVIKRGENLFLRVRDAEAATLKAFAGVECFPTDPAWRIEAKWVPFDPPQQFPITNMIGVTEPAPVPGKAVFTWQGRTVELFPIDEGDNELFFVLTDLTAGAETYEASRFLYAAPPKDGKVVLDFNRLQNPPCAFTTFATCPLPPKENRIPFRVTAGEKKYRGAH